MRETWGGLYALRVQNRPVRPGRILGRLRTPLPYGESKSVLCTFWLRAHQWLVQCHFRDCLCSVGGAHSQLSTYAPCAVHSFAVVISALKWSAVLSVCACIGMHEISECLAF